MADIRQVTEQFAVAPQVELDEFAEFAEMGFTHIINNRPDGEAGDQPSSAEAEAAAKAAGLTYVHAPFVGQPTAEAVKAVMNATKQAGGKTLAYCRSGTRSVTAWAFAQATENGNAEAIVSAAENAGYNLGPLAGLLRQLGAR
ncbi:MAG TPA: TIGR01244 family sulfur transferase [Hyphomonadaceae bacterium]|nr:TIGR01244 family sulfur transferase [Hyphomonadaceae bacterium]HPN04181.1 TIGR01244 family sulfur transferase [Hyphomonadaceae bacterium]